MDSGRKIDWLSNSSHLMLNPKMPRPEMEQLFQLSQKFSMPETIWIASSGSTKSAQDSVKLIAISKKAFRASAEAVNRHLQVFKRDIWIKCLPDFHVGGLTIFCRAFLLQNQVLQLDRWDARSFAVECQRHSATLTSFVPTQVHDIVEQSILCPKSLRAVVVGGGKLSEDLYNRAIELSWPLLPSFGMTELCSQIATAELDSWKFHRQDLKLLSHVHAKVTDEGLLMLQSPAMMNGYAQIQNGDAIWREPFSEGWYLTNDFAKIEGELLYPLGRSSEYLKILGEGVNLLRVQDKFEARFLGPQKKLINEFMLSADADNRRGHNIVLNVLQSLGEDAFMRIQEIVESYNQAVSAPERITEIKKVEAISWKRKSPESW